MAFTAICNREAIALKNRQLLPRLVTKTLRIMQFTATLLLVFALSVSARTSSQTITLSGKGIPFQQVFSIIEKQAGYLVVGNKDWFKALDKVSVDVTNMEVPAFLELIFKDKPYDFEIKSKTIFIKEKPTITRDNLWSTIASLDLPPIKISGTVIGADDQPVAGANIIVKGTKRGVATDANGKFTIEADVNEVLIISSVGYNDKEVKIKNTGVSLVVALEKSISQLDETVVTAYRTITQRLSTGNITTVSAKDIAKQPVINPLLALQGRVPGMVIRQSTGNPGTGVGVMIQGRNTLLSGTDPFYVIDGVPYTSELAQDNAMSGILGQSGSNGTLFGRGSSFSFINPDDIESITVLKDADATSIYGSRAANGAIIITTKKGKSGRTQTNINTSLGFGKVPHFIEMMNTEEYLAMRQQALTSDGLSVGPFDYDLNGTWDANRNVNWQKELIGGTAKYTNTNISVSGGNATTSFLVSATYNLQGTVMIDPHGQFKDRKGNLYFNLNNISSNQKFRLQLSGSYMVDNNHLPFTDLTYSAVTLAPNFPSLYKRDGTLNWESELNPNYISNVNPAANLQQVYSNKTYHLWSSLQVDYEIVKGLEFKTRLGYDILRSDKFNGFPLTSYSPLFLTPTSQPTANFGNSNINSWIIEPQATYNRSEGKGTLNFILGSSFQQQTTVSNVISAYGFQSDDQLKNINNATRLFPDAFAALDVIYKYAAVFGQAGFNWDNKYIINLSMRRDGSSRFGSANQFHDFGSIGGAWIFSSEKPMQWALPFLSFGKLKASYGTTGNDQIGDYSFMSLYSSDNSASQPYQGLNKYFPTKLPNPYYGWETTKKTNVGLDLGLFDNRIQLTVNYQINRSLRQLADIIVPSITGFYTVSGNLNAKIQNTSWETSVNTTNIKRKSFEWSSRLIITIPKNKLVAFPDLANSAYSSLYFIGQPTNVQQLYKYSGIDANTGLYEFETADGGKTSEPNYLTDLLLLKVVNPKCYGGLENNFSYKNFSLSFLFQFSKQLSYSPFVSGYPWGFKNTNLPAYMSGQFWQKPGDQTNYPRLTTTYNYFSNWAAAMGSELNYEDASFIRCTNLSLSWQVPPTMLKLIFINDARIYVQGQNLFTITSYRGLDPETGSISGLPILRVITIGVKIGL